MAKSKKWKRGERIGKDKVTPVQVAFLIDRYLSDPKLLLSSPNLLFANSLKEQKVIVDQENAKHDQEKTRVQNLLHGMQHVMNAYNSSAPEAIQVAASTSQPNNIGVSPSDLPKITDLVLCITHQILWQHHCQGNKRVGNFTAPCSSQSITKKRKSPEVSVDAAPSYSNKERRKIQRAAEDTNYLTVQTSPGTETPVNNSVANESSGLTSSVAKCLFTSSDISPPGNPACLSTPQKQVSPQGDVSITPTNSTVVTKIIMALIFFLCILNDFIILILLVYPYNGDV